MVGVGPIVLLGTDHLLLNRAYLDNGKRMGTDEHRRRVAAHQLGHVLGFCHKSYGTGMYPSLLRGGLRP